MSQKVVFRPIGNDVNGIVPMPKPAKSCIPEWFKEVPVYVNNSPEIGEGGTMNTTMKSCMPFLDTFLSGYIQNTWCDIYIDNTKEDSPHWKYSLSPSPINKRNGPSYYPEINNFSSNEFEWKQQWIPQLPPGYSMLYTHPFNRYDLPFLSLTGIVDNDKYFMEPFGANHPFFLTKNFKGIIPKGTPMFQMIPIKREYWKSEGLGFDEKIFKQFFQVRSFFSGGYKKLYWNKKRYE